MRIVIDCRMLYGPKRGIGHYLDHLVRALAEIDGQNRYTLFYVSGRADPGQIVRLPQNNFETRVLRMPNGMFIRLFRQDASLSKIARGIPRQYDIVHEPGFEPLPLAPRMVLTIHDLNILHQAEVMPATLVAQVRRRMQEAALHARQIITDSENTRRDVIEMLGCSPEKVHCVYLGVDPVTLQIPPEETQQELDDLGVQKPFLLSLGDILKGKNLLSAMRGWARVSQEIRERHQFVIAGMPGDAFEELQGERGLLQLQSDVVLTGYVSAQARRVLLNRAMALVFPSIYEGFGLPPLEAMACGVPTASARSSSIPEVVGNAGLLVDDFRDPEAWADAITRLLTDERLRDTLIKKGRVRAAEFTWQRTAQETLRVYNLAMRT